MKIGVLKFFTVDSIDPIVLARELEGRGFESLFLPDHSHIPLDLNSLRPGGRRSSDGERLGDVPDEYNVPAEYADHYEPLMTLAAIGQATSRLMLGTAVTVLTERDPIVAAKQLSTLDALSGGRVLFGVGAGWNRSALRNHGVDFEDRFALFRERVEAMRAIWTNDVASYNGRLVSLTSMWQGPKPQGIPFLLGVNGPNATRQVVAFGDEWMPSAALWKGHLADEIGVLRRLAEDAGRSPIPVTVVLSAGDPSSAGDEEFGLSASGLEKLSDLGVNRVVLVIPFVPTDEVYRTVDRYQDIAKAFL